MHHRIVKENRIGSFNFFIRLITKRSFFFLSLILILLSSTAGISYSSEQGYTNRFTLLSPGKITGPAFSDESVFIARDNDGIYKLSRDGKKEGYIELKGSFSGICEQENRIYVLYEYNGNRMINVYKSSDLELVKSIPSGDCIFIRNYKNSIVAGCNDGFKLIDSDGNQYRVSLSAEEYYLPGEDAEEKKKLFLPDKSIKAVFVDGNKIIVSYMMGESPEAGGDKRYRHYVAVYEGTKRINRWESPPVVYLCKDNKVFTSDMSASNKISIYSIEGKKLSELKIPKKTVVAKNMVFNRDGYVLVFTTGLSHKGMYKILNFDIKTGKILWQFPVGGRIGSQGVAFIEKKMYVLRNVRGSRYILDRIDLETGVGDGCIYPGYMGQCGLTAYNRFLYLTDMKRIKSSKFPSLYVLNPDFKGDNKFTVTPPDRLLYSYAELTYASNEDPRFKKYMSGKFRENPKPYDRKMINGAVDIYDGASKRNPFNPFLEMYNILAKLEAGEREDELQAQIKSLDEKCGYDVFTLSLVGALFSRYNYDGIGDHFLEKASKFAPAAAEDYERAFATLISSPGIHFMGVIRRMAGDNKPRFDRIVKIVDYMTKIMPSNEYNYYIWSSISQFYAREGKKKEANLAAEKARYYYKHNQYLSSRDIAHFDMLSVLALIMGILFLVLSIWFSFRANRRKNHFLAEISGLKQLNGTAGLLREQLKPGEKNIMGFLISLGIVSILVDGLLLLLMQITHETYRKFYNVGLGISILIGLIVGIYLIATRLGIESKYYGKVTVTGDKSWKSILNNSFLAFMSEQEKIVLISLSVAGVFLAYVLLNILANVIFIQQMPLSMMGGTYGNDRSLTVLKSHLKRNPKNPYTHLLMGYERHIRGEYEKAEGHYLRFLARHPRDINASANLGLVRSNRNPEEGISILGKLSQNRGLKNLYKYADRTYYDLTLLEKKAVSKDAVSPYQKDLDEMKSGTIEANKIVHPGKLLLFPPQWEQEKRGLASEMKISRIFYSYFFPFISIEEIYRGITHRPAYGISYFALIITVAAYWLWTVILIVSLFLVKQPIFIPFYCKRCGKLVCGRCAPPDGRNWCDECCKNERYHIPGTFQIIIPGLNQIRNGHSIRGVIFMILFFYSVLYSLLLFIPLREGSILYSGGNRYIGFLQALNTPYTIFPYNVTNDPVLRWFVTGVVLVFICIFILNALEVFYTGKYREGEESSEIETQILDYARIKRAKEEVERRKKIV
ncbi:MAG: hypothetical protein K8T10_00810 [Candidatus Eremiobacteraeota bacterium]|nr:hypothetical protein [Candidatus Eremiobacteraeota bacterium]